MSLIRGHSPIPVRSKLANRFYEPIILLVGLNVAWTDLQTSKAPDLSSDKAQSPEYAFHCFVNKLGQLCDSERGGKTVTAFVILQFPDGIQYRFVSNQREEKDLIHTQSFMTEILNALGRQDACKIQDITSHILRKSLSFTRPRVGSYVKSLKQNTELCIISCEREGTNESGAIIERLKTLRELVWFSDDRSLDDKAFSGHCENLINTIGRLYQSQIDELIRSKTKEGRINESKCWCEFRHAAGRLLSYLQAVNILFSTQKRWPELFENFEIRYVVSSLPAGSPLRNSRTGKFSMEEIIGRMTSDPVKTEIYAAYALELERFGVNENIRKLAGSKTFRPIVHAEALLLDSLEKDGGTHPSRFFGGYRYIGCSKPTCRLCSYYFSFHASGVEVRPAHRNLYLNWRMPDVYSNQGPGAANDREKLMMKILDRVREDAFRTLKHKMPDGKLHDSNTEPTCLIDSSLMEEPVSIEHLKASFDSLSIKYFHDEVTPKSSSSSSFGAANCDSDEEDGGAML